MFVRCVTAQARTRAADASFVPGREDCDFNTKCECGENPARHRMGACDLTGRGFIDGEYEDGGVRGCVFVAGKRGFGKTTSMIDSLRECLGGTIFFDSLSKHHSVLADHRIIQQPGELKWYLEPNRGRRFRVLYQPRRGDLDSHFAAVCTIARATGNLILAIDELDKLTGSRFGPSWMCTPFYHLVNYGRHCHVSLIATARRPNNVPRGFTSECLSMRLFRITEPAQIDYFEEYIGRGGARRLRSLPRFEFLKWEDGADLENQPNPIAAASSS